MDAGDHPWRGKVEEREDMRYRDKWPQYAEQINKMQILPAKKGEFEAFANKAIRHKDIYISIETDTGVPWFSIAVMHERESSSNFNTYLGNGDPLNRVTTHVPAGRGPFFEPNAFQKGAKDALHLDGLDAVVPPWPIEKILYWQEVFNGGGYSRMGIPSPYIWGGTSIQVRGKYVRDGVFDPNAWDTQLGCAGMLWMIGFLDTSVHFTRET